MKNKNKPEEIIENSIRQSVETKLELLKNHSNEIIESAHLMINSLQVGGKILFCGNGGSAADSQHIAAELIIRYRSSVERKALAAIALSTDTSVITAGGNDYGFENIFARQVEGLARENDVLIGISTSGNSENVLRALKAAKDRGIRTIGLLGGNGGKIKNHCDLKIIVPSETTARIQEAHITIGHIWCEIIEEMMFS